MKGAVLHGLSERLEMRSFSFEDPTHTCDEFLDDVICFAKHCLSRKRLKNAEAFLHPVDPDPVDANLAQVWYLERLAVAVFASVAPEPLLPSYTALGDSLRLGEWDQEMVLGVENGGKTRSVSHRPLVKILSEYFSNAQKTIQILSVEELIQQVTGEWVQTQGARQVVEILVA